MSSDADHFDAASGSPMPESGPGPALEPAGPRPSPRPSARPAPRVAPDGSESERGLAESASQAAVAAGKALREKQIGKNERAARSGSGRPAAGPPSPNPSLATVPDSTTPASVRAPGRNAHPAGAREVDQRVVILSGLSGAGKTAATKLFEDLGYTCMDNLPGELLPALAELVSDDRQRFEKVAIVLDVRAGDAPLALAAMRGALEGRGIKPRVIFLEARDDVLIRRFSETRHRHPLAGRRGIAGSIAEERRLLEPVRAESDSIVDTSDLSLRQLKERIFAHLADDSSDAGIVFQLISFGFKYGVPLEADLVFDVRFMENPYYVDELRHLSGLTPAVRDYVMGQPIAQQFFDFLARFLDLTIPGFKSEGKTRLTVAVGCTGGYHRSIVIAEQLRGWLERRGYGTVAVFHRELERE
jgi:RNase adapter protein RapZ